MRRLLLIMACFAFVSLGALTPVAHAVDAEFGIGAGYNPGVFQEPTLESDPGFGYVMSFAAWMSDHVLTEVNAQFYSSKLKALPDDVNRQYFGQLGVRYFSKPRYVRQTDGTALRQYTLVNPYLRLNAGITDGTLDNEDINTALSYAVGGGARFDLSSKADDLCFDVEIRTMTATTADGKAQTYLGGFLTAVLQVKMFDGN